VGRAVDYAGLGVDVEQLQPGLSLKAARRVCTPDEYAWVDTGDALRRTMLFSAKEAVFKALFPIERVWLGFGDVELMWSPERDAFEATLLKRASAAHPPGTRLEVVCRVSGSEVLSTTYALPGR
jgi:4'-phosphopantetheinyl transferase EntD